MSAEALLENPAVRARITRFTLEQYHQLGEYSATGKRTELIRGYVFDKMSKSPLHSSIASYLYDLLYPTVPGGWWLRKEEPLTFGDSEPEPDVSLVKGTRNTYGAGHPKTAALVVEVAVTTLLEDRALASVYAEAGVEEYWIVIPREHRVEVYRQPKGGEYLEHFSMTGEQTLACTAVPGVQVNLGTLFAG